VAGPDGDVLVDWKVVVLMVVVPGAKVTELVVAVGTAVVAGSEWLIGDSEDGEILDCCMICAVVSGAEGRCQ
jgi:hypothetical protein